MDVDHTEQSEPDARDVSLEMVSDSLEMPELPLVSIPVDHDDGTRNVSVEEPIVTETGGERLSDGVSACATSEPVLVAMDSSAHIHEKPASQERSSRTNRKERSTQSRRKVSSPPRDLHYFLCATAARAEHVSMFPPMLTPLFNHTVVRSNYLIDSSHKEGNSHGADTAANKRTCNAPSPTTLPALKHSGLGRQQTHARTQHAFQPTGLLSTPYRHYTNYKLAMQATTAESIRHKQQENKALRDIFQNAHRTAKREGGMNIRAP